MSSTIAAEVRSLRLREYRRDERVPLNAAQRDGLLDALPDLAVAPSRGMADHYDLTPGATVGIVSVPGLLVEIRPKVAIERLVYMLSFGLDLAKWHDQVRVSFADSFVDAMANVLIWHVESAIKRGLLHGYRVEEAALYTVRGRIRIEDQIRIRPGWTLPVEVRFDEFSEDILENRLLHTALRVVGSLPIQDVALRARLRHVSQHFQRLGTVPTGAGRVPRVHYTRLNEHYRSALEWARLVLESASFETVSGRLAGRGLLFNMNKVFETFVRSALREELGLEPSVFPTGAECQRRYFDQGRRIALEPDLSWWRDGRCLFVGDVKYKWRDESVKARNGDLFQLHAYIVGYGLTEGLVIYAGDTSEVIDYNVVRVNHQLRVISLRVDGELSALRRECHRVAGVVSEMAVGRPAFVNPGLGFQ